MTISESICGDFPIFCGWSPDSLGALFSFLTTLAVIAGVIIAYLQLAGWRSERLGLRRAEIAEEVIALALNVEDSFRHVRSRFDSIPKEKAGDNQYYYQRRFERMMTYSDLFASLRDAQIRVRAVVGNDKVDDAVNELFEVRNKVLSAIDILAELADDDPTPDDRDFRKNLRSDLYGSFDQTDKLGLRVTTSVALIEAELTPLVRLGFV